MFQHAQKKVSNDLLFGIQSHSSWQGLVVAQRRLWATSLRKRRNVVVVGGRALTTTRPSNGRTDGRRRWEVVWNDDGEGARRIFCPLFNCPQPLGYCSAIYVARDSCSEWQMGGRAYMDLWADNLPCLDSGLFC